MQAKLINSSPSFKQALKNTRLKTAKTTQLCAKILFWQKNLPCLYKNIILKIRFL